MRSDVRSSWWCVGLFLLAVLSAGCSNPWNPDSAFGTVLARVGGNEGLRVQDVEIYVHDLPNRVGSFYSVGQRTNADGTARFGLISPGRHRVEMTVPAGFVAGPAGAIEVIDVAAGATVTVAFVIVRK